MIITRFAPSPTGLLHLGHAYAAGFAWRHARQHGGKFLLRIEDIDPTRCRPEHTHAIMDDLRWLGLIWDGPMRQQSRHLAEYRALLDRLAERDLIYPCFCTRADIAREVAQSAAAPHGPDGALLYPGICRALPASLRHARSAAGLPHAWRLDMAKACAMSGPGLSYRETGHGVVACDPARFGDVVLARKDAPASYHLCVTHDDALQEVNLVTRSVDLQAATDVHRLLQVLMGWPAPIYAHHKVLTDQDGQRLAKRDGAPTLQSLRDNGWSPAQVLDAAGLDPW